MFSHKKHTFLSESQQIYFTNRDRRSSQIRDNKITASLSSLVWQAYYCMWYLVIVELVVDGGWLCNMLNNADLLT